MRFPCPVFRILPLVFICLATLTGGAVPVQADERAAPAAGRWERHPAAESFGAPASALPARLFVVRSRGPLAPTGGVVVHARRGSAYLLSGDPEAIAGLRERGCSVVELSAVPALPAAPRRWTPVDTPDPVVQRIVDQVQWEGIEEIVAWMVEFGTRYSFARNHLAIVESIRDRFEALGLEVTLHEFVYQNKKMYNVEATQRGTVAPDSFVVICGHFDSTSEQRALSAPGADDNATGVAAVMTVAQLLSRHQFEYSIRYICFAGEEQGLRGSNAYAKWAQNNGVAIVGALNFDMLGWWTPGVKKDMEIETNVASQWLAAAVVNAADLYTDTPYLLHVFDGAWWGDHASFWGRGYAAVNHEESWDWYDPDFNPYYHTTQDLPEHLDPDFTTGNVRVAVASLATIARLVAPRAVAVDVRPGSSPNPFNPKSHGVLPVLLAGAADLDVHDIDASTLRIAGAAAPLATRITDMGDGGGGGPDGIDDLWMKFASEDVAAAIGPTGKRATATLHLTGALVDGTRIAGDDLVSIVGAVDGPIFSDDAPSSAPVTRLGAAVPNPFNPVTRISFSVAREGYVDLSVYDVAGRRVARLIDEVRPAGDYTVMWSAGGFASGVYFYQLHAGGIIETRKMVLLK